MRAQVTRWTVDYGEGRVREVKVPHAWRQEVDVRWEGPAIYRTLIDVPVKECKLRFHGVSYACEVLVDGTKVAEHRGIWDAFDVPLANVRGRRAEIEVRVTKNGGVTFPSETTLAGCIPEIFHTFGGIFRPVEIVSQGEPLEQKVAGSRYTLNGSILLFDHEALYIRAVQHQGWYPEVGAPHPTIDIIDREIEYAASLGFNTFKFFRWVPPHSYLEALARKGMHAWIELPISGLSSEAVVAGSIESELESIVRQYAHHSNIAIWSLGVGAAEAPAEWRDRWSRKVSALTGCPAVSESRSGSLNDPRKFGSLEELNLVGEVQHLSVLLDAFQSEPVGQSPKMIGSSSDYDHHRDLEQVAELMPFWASSMSELNDRGVRARYDLPKFIHGNRFAHEPEQSGHRDLLVSSLEKGLFVRKSITEAIRSQGGTLGYVLNNLRDTPVSTSGIITDWARFRHSPEDFWNWNASEVLFLIQSRVTSWVRGGYRLAHIDHHNMFSDRSSLLKVGLASPNVAKGALIWKISDDKGQVVKQGVADQISVPPGANEVAQIFVEELAAGKYELAVSFGAVQNRWNMFVHDRPEFNHAYLLWADDRYDGVSFGNEGVGIAVGWRDSVWARIKAGLPTVVLLDGEGGKPAPFWRESITAPSDPWEQALAYCPDQTVDPKWLSSIGNYETLQYRIDTRTYEEAPYIARIDRTIFTTYRPHGGQGTQPLEASHNPAGLSLLADLIALVAQ